MVSPRVELCKIECLLVLETKFWARVTSKFTYFVIARGCPLPLSREIQKRYPQWFNILLFLLVILSYNHGRPACNFVLTSCSSPFTGRLIKIADQFLKMFHLCFYQQLSTLLGIIFIVLSEIQQKEQLMLPNSHVCHVSLESTHWSSFRPSMKNYTKRP